MKATAEPAENAEKFFLGELCDLCGCVNARVQR